MKIWDLGKLTGIGGSPLMPGPREPGLYCISLVANPPTNAEAKDPVERFRFRLRLRIPVRNS